MAKLNRIRLGFASVAASSVVLGLAWSEAQADVILDPNLTVCSFATPDQCGADPNQINPASINLFIDGSKTAVSPLLVIVGVPNGAANPTLSLPNGVSAATGAKYYGLNNATSGGLTGAFEGNFFNTSAGSAYNAAGIVNDGGGSSENASNWFTGIDSNLTEFNLYAYAITTMLAQAPGINIDLDNLALGSRVIGYACLSSGATCSGGDVASTPFTTSGLNTGKVPEPASLALFGTALAGLGLLGRRRRRRKG